MALYDITTKKEFKEKVLENPKVVLVDFWAGWCAPCVAMTPHLSAIAEEMDRIVDVVKVNIDDLPENYENQQLAGEYGVRSIPNMPVFVGGKEERRIIGLTPKLQLGMILRDIAKNSK